MTPLLTLCGLKSPSIHTRCSNLQEWSDRLRIQALNNVFKQDALRYNNYLIGLEMEAAGTID